MPPAPACHPAGPSDCFPKCCPLPGGWEGGQKQEPTDLQAGRGCWDRGQARGVTTGWHGIVRVGLEVQAVNGEEALLLSRTRHGKDRRWGQADSEDQRPSPRAAGWGHGQGHLLRWHQGATQGPPPITGAASPAPLRREGKACTAPDGHKAAQRHRAPGPRGPQPGGEGQAGCSGRTGASHLSHLGKWRGAPG